MPEDHATPPPPGNTLSSPPSSPPTQPAVFTNKPPHKSPFLLIGILLFAIFLASGGLFLFSKLSTPAPTKPLFSQEVTTPNPTTTPLTLELTSPTDNQQAVNGEIIVQGKTLPHLSVAIFSEYDEIVVESDDSGTFEGSIILEPGENIITTTVYGKDDTEKSASVTVNYEI